ncbi:M20 family metallopeptidase [Actinopolymorpha sp. B17G11]|uniref:M20 family metallopeptidase n=1 Tax=unclassified Actinopolymorpha TaxID=2627063 RepID=UPI0032D8D5A4
MGGSIAGEIRVRLEARRQELVDLLAEWVSIESGSDDPAGLAEMAGRLEQRFGEFGTLTRHPLGPGGAPHLSLTVPGAEPDAAPVVVLGHYDTVWARGTLSRMPLRIEDGILTGPGSFDMKSGLVLLLYALRELKAQGRAPRRQVRILLSCDEEVSSRTSRELIETAATGAAAAFVLESPLPGGALKTARKGIATYRLAIGGRAAHAGIEPDKGASAIVELAHQVQALHRLNDRERGTTVNVGVVRGGSRPNVVAAHAEAEIDVRVATAAEASRVEQAITGLIPAVTGTTLTVRVEASRPPMESTPASRQLFAHARAIAAGMGVGDLGEGSTGGASDANLVAAMGVPTLDGLGPEGGGAHADHEHVLIESMPRRAALIAGLLAEV